MTKPTIHELSSDDESADSSGGKKLTPGAFRTRPLHITKRRASFPLRRPNTSKERIRARRNSQTLDEKPAYADFTQPRARRPGDPGRARKARLKRQCSLRKIGNSTDNAIEPESTDEEDGPIEIVDIIVAPKAALQAHREDENLRRAATSVRSNSWPRRTSRPNPLVPSGMKPDVVESDEKKLRPLSDRHGNSPQATSQGRSEKSEEPNDNTGTSTELDVKVAKESPTSSGIANDKDGEVGGKNSSTFSLSQVPQDIIDLLEDSSDDSSVQIVSGPFTRKPTQATLSDDDSSTSSLDEYLRLNPCDDDASGESSPPSDSAGYQKTDNAIASNNAQQQDEGQESESEYIDGRCSDVSSASSAINHSFVNDRVRNENGRVKKKTLARKTVGKFERSLPHNAFKPARSSNPKPYCDDEDDSARQIPTGSPLPQLPKTEQANKAPQYIQKNLSSIPNNVEIPLGEASQESKNLPNEPTTVAIANSSNPSAPENTRTGRSMVTISSNVKKIPSSLLQTQMPKKVPSHIARLKDSKDFSARIVGKKRKRSQRTKDNGDDYDARANRTNSAILTGTAMTPIEHLCSTTIDKETGLPVMRMSLHGTPDNIIYDFEFKARKSQIPNAGNGVFCTFLGARELIPWKQKLGEKLLDDRILRQHMSIEKKLTARHPDGFDMELSLTGSNMFGQCTHPYVLRPLIARLPGHKQDTMVKFTDPLQPFIQVELDSLCSTRCSKQRIGFLGINEESDYIGSKEIKFSSDAPGCGGICLGRYGPFQRKDRKIDFDFHFKCFIFSDEPNEWCFGVNEKIFGKTQIIDITDDDSGEPHRIARENIPMYVNEVGYSNLAQNVHACSDEKDRTVRYYLSIQEPMKPGESVECLVDYFQKYEEVRERKGYGLKNLKEGVRGDGHLPARLERNFESRDQIVSTIIDIKSADLYRVVEWIDNCMRLPLVQKIDDFLCQLNTKRHLAFNVQELPTARQLIALRRIHWLGTHLLERHTYLLENGESGRNIQFFGCFKNLSNQCKNSIVNMNWESFSHALSTFRNESFRGLRDRHGRLYCEALEEEIAEEFCFLAKNKIPLPFDHGLWCGVARDLTKHLCLAVSCFLSDPLTASLPDKGGGLCEQIITASVNAMEKIRSDCSRLLFPPGLVFSCASKFQTKISALESLTRLIQNHQYLVSNTTHEKGIVASLVDMLVYDEITKLECPPELDIYKVKLKPRASVLMMRYEVNSSNPCTPRPNEDHSALSSIPRGPMGNLPPPGKINMTWYAVWQVAYLANAFSEVFLPEDSPYSVPLLCKRLKIRQHLVEFAISRGISLERQSIVKAGVNKGEFQFGSTAQKRSKRAKKESTTDQLAKKQRKFKFQNDLFWEIVWNTLESKLNWKLDVGNRPNDFYFCPPGIERRKGFRNRVDFFDSVPLVMNSIQTNSRWNNTVEVKHALDLYSKCLKLAIDLKKSKKLPKLRTKKELVSWLIQIAEQKPDGG